MIFIDSNVTMYLVGAPHPNKDIAQRLLESATARQERLVTDAEVLHEILHRYHAIQRLEAIQPAFDALVPLVDEVLPIDLRTVQRAKEIVGASVGLSARDAVHLAAMEHAGVRQLMSFDSRFDRWPAIERLN